MTDEVPFFLHRTEELAQIQGRTIKVPSTTNESLPFLICKVERTLRGGLLQLRIGMNVCTSVLVWAELQSHSYGHITWPPLTTQRACLGPWSPWSNCLKLL